MGTILTSPQTRTPNIQLQRKDLPLHFNTPIHLRPPIPQRLQRLPSIPRIHEWEVRNALKASEYATRALDDETPR
jgi:hypothetical protein